MKRVKLLFAAVSLVLVLVVTYWEFGQLASPGSLHPSHAGVRELRGRSRCTACHGDESVSMTNACLACHDLISGQLSGGFGLHGNVRPAIAQACQLCHAEHTHGELALVTDNSFKIAGVKEPKRYGHRDIDGYTLEGAHDTLDCKQCHMLAEAKTIRPGNKRFLGLSQDCIACHDDQHDGSFGLDCASCHGQASPFDQVAAFKHTDRFALAGGHDGVSCKDCHEQGTDYAIADLHKDPPKNIRTCTDCHSTPHSDQLINAVAKARGTTRRRTCVACHDVSHESFLSPKSQMPDELHAATGFSLDPPHHEQTCQQCHEEIGLRVRLADGPDLPARFAELFPKRSPDDCRACHEDHHAGQFDAGDTKGLCLACHERLQFKPSTFGVDRHAQTPFALTGLHEQTECAKCHESVDEVQRFAGVSTDCTTCHEDTHAGQFDPGPTLGRCDECHDTRGFAPTRFGQAMHGKTKFPLTGGHLAVGCRDCHVDPDEGSARRFVSTSMDCAGCHEDVHDGVFDGPDKPLVVAGRRGCARCHVAEGFDRVNWTDDTHGRWTGYALQGAHARAACTDCHAPQRRPDGGQLTFDKAPRECTACHSEPHAGQFRVDEVSDCARCHTETKTFAESIFDHQTQSRFELDKTHSALKCSACHKSYDTPEGVGVIRYKPLGVRCQDCHGFTSYQDRGG